MATDYMILTEKKSECDNFAKALGGMKGVFDNHSYQLVHAQGHLLKLAEPDQQVPSSLKDKYSSWKPENMPWDISDFSWRRVPTSASNVKSLLGHIKKVSKDCDAIIIATDSDLTGEGELLAWEIINAIGWQGKVYREYHADESVKAIQKAMTNLKDVSDQQKDGDYLKANLRNRWDFVSIQLTRLATSYARQAGYSIRAINQGRLKSVMIRMVKDQLQAIEDYVRKPYYEAKYKDDQGHLYARKVDSKDEQAVAKIRHQNKHGAEVEANQLISPASVGAVKITDVYQAPKTLLDLSKLDGILSKKGYSSTTIKNVYQQLYEKIMFLILELKTKLLLKNSSMN